MKNLKRKFMSVISPLIPAYFKIEALYRAALEYYMQKERENLNGISLLFDASPEKKARNEVKKIVKQKRISELYLRLIELD